MKALPSLLLMAVSLNTLGADVEIDLGSLQLPPCTKMDWSNAGLFGIASPTYQQSEQRVTVSAVIGGSNVDDPTFQEPIRQCSATATQAVGITLMALQPGDAAGLYKSELSRCLTESALPIDIATVFLRSNTACLW